MKTINYQEAFAELQQIVSEIEDGEISVDLLSEKVNVPPSSSAFAKAN